MRKLSSNPLRWALALILMPLAPALVLLIAHKGAELAGHVSTLGMPFIVENPWVLAPIGGLFVGTMLALLFGAFSGQAANATS